jgi:hypothetical protein
MSGKSPQSLVRSDYREICRTRGADALTEVLHERLPDRAQFLGELARMESSGWWAINWAEGKIVGPKAQA